MLLALLAATALSTEWCWDSVPGAEEYELWWSRAASEWWDCQRLYVASDVLCSEDTAPFPGAGELIFVYVRATAAYRPSPTPIGVQTCA